MGDRSRGSIQINYLKKPGSHQKMTMLDQARGDAGEIDLARLGRQRGFEAADPESESSGSLSRSRSPSRRARGRGVAARIPAVAGTAAAGGAGFAARTPAAAPGTVVAARTPAVARATRGAGRTPRQPSLGSQGTPAVARVVARTPAASDAGNVMDHQRLEELFSHFHDKLDDWLEKEGSRFERAEARGGKAKETLKDCASKVCGYLKEHAPLTYEGLGPEAEGRDFVARTLPTFLATLEEERRVEQETMAALAVIVDKRFPKDDRLRGMKRDIGTAGAPLPVVKELLKLLPKQDPPSRSSFPKDDRLRG